MINILKVIVFSILIIIFFHYMWNYIKNTYSTKKTKDLVGSQTQKYKNILNELLQQKQNTTTFLSEEDKQLLNEDLTDFLWEQSGRVCGAEGGANTTDHFDDKSSPWFVSNPIEVLHHELEMPPPPVYTSTPIDESIVI